MYEAHDVTLLIFWGRRGGGFALFRQLENLFQENNLEIITSERPTRPLPDGSYRGISVFNFWRWLTARRVLLKLVELNNISNAVFVMPSPWDILLGRKLVKNGLNVVRMIHDATPHPGEFFPPKFWIRILLNDCSKILTFSEFVAQRLHDLYGQNPTLVEVIPFPRVQTKNISHREHGSNKKILLIGRGKKYQGQELFENACKMLNQKNLEIFIVGEGFKVAKSENGIQYKNYWSTETDLMNEIASSDLVVLPYLEASQSGTIPICNALNVPVVVTPVGGLVEQVIYMENGVISRDVSAKGLAEAIEFALQHNWEERFVPVKNQDKDIVKAIFNRSRL